MRYLVYLVACTFASAPCRSLSMSSLDCQLSYLFEFQIKTFFPGPHAASDRGGAVHDTTQRQLNWVVESSRSPNPVMAMRLPRARAQSPISDHEFVQINMRLCQYAPRCVALTISTRIFLSMVGATWVNLRASRVEFRLYVPLAN